MERTVLKKHVGGGGSQMWPREESCHPVTSSRTHSGLQYSFAEGPNPSSPLYVTFCTTLFHFFGKMLDSAAALMSKPAAGWRPAVQRAQELQGTRLNLLPVSDFVERIAHRHTR